MSFELFIECFAETRRSGISRDAVRSLFPIDEEESQPDLWRVHYDTENSSLILVTPLETDAGKLQSICVERPCGDIRLWESLLAILRMGSVVIYWPAGPPAIADERLAATLPQDLIDAIGESITVHSAEELLRAVQET